MLVAVPQINADQRLFAGTHHYLVAAAPVSVVVPVPVVMPASVIQIVPVSISAIPVPMAAMTPEVIVCPAYVTPRAAAIPAPVTGVMAVNKLFALLIHVRDPAAASLPQRIRRHSKDHQQAQHHYSKQSF